MLKLPPVHQLVNTLECALDNVLDDGQNMVQCTAHPFDEIYTDYGIQVWMISGQLMIAYEGSGEPASSIECARQIHTIVKNRGKNV